MARVGKMILAAAMAVLCCCSVASATRYIVGDEVGWSDPSMSNVSYADWALKHRFHVGDSLVFKYPSDAHTVLKVNRQDFEACHNSNPMASYKDGESIVHLSSAGPHWFICGETSHCNQGQKFGIMVVERRGRHSRAPSPSPAPAPSAGGEVMPAPVGASDEISPASSPGGAPAIAPAAGGATMTRVFAGSSLLVIVAALI
ncbi:mavicyanin [Selaginella moellendorffii]|nr:mavicyanin [Selaginella moellendorffii]|eukprot:XP_002972342.2 mavicyanin [Selaginella moellendorffii]